MQLLLISLIGDDWDALVEFIQFFEVFFNPVRAAALPLGSNHFI